MSSRMVGWSVSVLVVVAGIISVSRSAFAQQAPPSDVPARPKAGASRPAAGRGEARPAAGERPANNGQVRPQPGANAKPAAPQPPQPPFTLTPQEGAQLDKLLLEWQQKTQKVKKFNCDFDMWVRRAGKDEPEQSKGKIWYSNPDKGRYEIVGDTGEKWISDGRSIFYYNHPAKKVEENILPAEMQGKAISEGPLPFLFGAEAETQKRRYYLRIVTTADAKKQGHIWVEAYPRFQADAANFRKATVILRADEMLPFALEIIDPTGNNRTAYQFSNVRVNALLDIKIIWGNPWIPEIPKGYTKVVINPVGPAVPAPEARLRENTGRKPEGAEKPARK